MDPNALLHRFLDALANGNRAEVAESLSDLHDWIARGGMLPDARAAQAASNAAAYQLRDGH